ncbi:hypothetical protein [Pseudomonas kurunegalensis]|uniref:hypothetical protein n=1 Tax=Pseudomonas kurunegalensis TaxID=485880 RepID=UPI0025703E44|nr:hypothetical protein [Pseudomonas kurunegalensis]WJD64923.1 hypothetical protein QQ992_11665 [Pseudomonas kurunegalensis]
MTDKIGRVDFEDLELTNKPQSKILAGELHFVQLEKKDQALLIKKKYLSTEQPDFHLSIQDSISSNDTNANGITGRHLLAKKMDTQDTTPFYISAIPKKPYSKVTFYCSSDDKNPSIHAGLIWYKDRDGNTFTLEIRETSYTGKYTAGIAGTEILKIYLRCSGMGSAFDNFELEK